MGIQEIHDWSTGNNWKRLETTGNDWIRLETTGNDWIRLDTTGNDWKRLETTGNNWKRLGSLEATDCSSRCSFSLKWQWQMRQILMSESWWPQQRTSGWQNVFTN